MEQSRIPVYRPAEKRRPAARLPVFRYPLCFQSLPCRPVVPAVQSGRLMSPLQGFVSDAGSPGRCPGLLYAALSGLVRCGLGLEVRGDEVRGTGDAGLKLNVIGRDIDPGQVMCGDIGLRFKRLRSSGNPSRIEFGSGIQTMK